jgi:hypothetical protein
MVISYLSILYQRPFYAANLVHSLLRGQLISILVPPYITNATVMTLTEDQRLQLERLCKKFRIHFYPQLQDASLSQEQRRIFNNIRKLGTTKYDDYAVESTQQSEMAPWKLEAKELALQLTEAAQRCRRRNEASWRHACEPLVFARVNSDVAW